MKSKNLVLIFLCSIAMNAAIYAQGKNLFYYGTVKNDLYQLLKRQGFTIKKYNTPEAAVNAASTGAGVFITANAYPEMDPANRISKKLLDQAKQKKLRLYIEYPYAFPGLDIPANPVETHLERGVITTDKFGGSLASMSLLGIHNSHVLPVEVKDPLIVLAKVVGLDRAEYGLTDTKVYPLLFEQENALVCMTGLSNFQTGRYGPNASIKELWTDIITRITGRKTVLNKWQQDVQPVFTQTKSLPVNAQLNCIKNGVDWYFNARLLVHPSWKQEWEKYGNIDPPLGPPISQSKPSGDGSLGIIEGHTSTIYYNGTHRYRYCMRADDQGEVSMAMAMAGQLFNNEKYKQTAANLIDYVFKTSTLRADERKDPNSPVYGLIGWSTYTPSLGVFYGDDNARAILGMIAASAYLKTNKWDKEIAEAIMANFRTSGTKGFRGERLEQKNILKNGWQYYYNRDLVHPAPFFESWLWACYLWLYDKTGYEPLLTRTKEGIKTIMSLYPDKWLWGSSLQSQRAHLILALAWLVRVENTEEHRHWLDMMVTEMLKYQADCGAIREEIGTGKGHFRELKKNSDYCTDEGSLIFKNGDEVACMIYANNFALFSLNEAARATGSAVYKKAVDKLSDFLIRIQVQSENHKDLNGGWFRGFDYGKWDYWASNSDAGWGAWCTLSGWIQSWIVTTQAQIMEKQSFWELTKSSSIAAPGKDVIKFMMQEAK